MTVGAILEPNNTPFPSSLTNTPEFAAMLSSPNTIMAIGTVREEVAIAAPDGSAVLTPQGPINDLMSLRQRYPFLPIFPIPVQSANIVLALNTGIAGLYQGELQIPDGMTMGILGYSGPAGAAVAKPVFMNTKGSAEVPTVSNQFAGSYMLRQGAVFYLGGVRSIGFAGAEASIVTVELFSPDQWPRY